MSEQNFNREPEETEEVYIDTEYNPLNEPINEKPYTKPNVRIDEADLQGEIPEPDFTPPPMNMREPEGGREEAPPKQTQQRQQREVKPKPEPFNEEFDNMTKRESGKSAKQMATMILQGYEWAHVPVNQMVQIKKSKVNKLVTEGKLNLKIRVPYDNNGNTVSVGEFIDEFNDQNSNLISVDPEWKAEVHPVLTRVLEKRGVGATDEQMLMFLFGKDIATKGLQISAALGMQKEMLNTWVTMTSQNQAGYSATPQQASNTTATPTKNYENDRGETVVEFDPLNEEEPNFTDDLPDELSVNHQVEQMINPDGTDEKRKRGRPRKK